MSTSQLFIILNRNCNLKCNHCCFNCSPKQTNCLEVKRLKDIIQKADDNNLDVIDFSGGEPTLYDNFQEILLYTLSKKFKIISVASNLVNIDSFKDILSNLSIKDKERLFFRLGIDGHNEETHDWLRGNGAFNTLMNGISTLKSNGIKLRSANTLVHKNNIHFINETVELVNNLGFSNNNWLSIFPYGRGKSFSKYQLTTDFWFSSLYNECNEYAEKYCMGFTFCGPFLNYTDDVPQIFNSLILKDCNSNGIIYDADNNVYAGCLKNMFTTHLPIGRASEPFDLLKYKVENYFDNINCSICEMKFACKGIQINKIAT
jgi:MoaA/NifB/PqqE/SkfB family radical SAM enzyme